jgi:hypothetical protein
MRGHKGKILTTEITEDTEGKGQRVKKYLEPLHLFTLYLFTLHASALIPHLSSIIRNSNREDGEVREES